MKKLGLPPSGSETYYEFAMDICLSVHGPLNIVNNDFGHKILSAR